MAVEQDIVDKVRASIALQRGNKVQIKQDEGRNKSNVREGVIQNVYPSVFTVLVKGEKSREDQILSYSYSDIVTKGIRMTLCG